MLDIVYVLMYLQIFWQLKLLAYSIWEILPLYKSETLTGISEEGTITLDWMIFLNVSHDMHMNQLTHG
jgi:hypothetical protein